MSEYIRQCFNCINNRNCIGEYGSIYCNLNRRYNFKQEKENDDYYVRKIKTKLKEEREQLRTSKNSNLKYNSIDLYIHGIDILEELLEKEY